MTLQGKVDLTWRARMIAADEDLDGAPLLRREFALEDGHGPVRSAVLHLTALGVVEASINGEPVSDELLAPGWSSYEWRVRYRSHDVTALLAPTYEIVLALGNGWYRGRLGFLDGRAIYGDELGAFAQLEIEYDDGHRQLVVTDETWTAGRSLGDRQRPLRRPDHRRASGPRPSRQRPCPGVRPRPAHLRHHAADPAPRVAAPREDLDVAVRGDVARLRGQPGRLAALHGAG